MTERLIVVGIDGSPGSRRALDWALRHAAATKASVEAISAFAWDGPDWLYRESRGAEETAVREEQSAQVEQALAEIDNPPTVSQIVVEGNPVEVLTRAAAKADLLVLGSHGRGHLATALLGSVGEGCIRHGSTPVVVVPTRKRIPAPASAVTPASMSGIE